MSERRVGRTAAEAGWHLSAYNLSARIPGEGRTAVANLMTGALAELTVPEILLLAGLDRVDADSPLLEPFKRRGLIVNADERAALDAMARKACEDAGSVSMTICPTMGCNFDCPYCFEDHRPGIMSAAVQDQTVGLAERLLERSGAKALYVSWYGGEPLLAADVIASLSDRLIALAERRGAAYEASMITNGYLLNRRSADLLERARIRTLQITLDGIGQAHDATRRLAGGGPTFGVITENLLTVKIPGKVRIRHNVHAGNAAEAQGLKALVAELAGVSGNDLEYYPHPVFDSAAARRRGSDLSPLPGSEARAGIGDTDIRRFGPARGSFCTAQQRWTVCVDEQGRLYKCMENMVPDQCFGTAGRWDPGDPLNTADHPDRLTRYLNTAGLPEDPECRACVWLPMCMGGCPYSRLAGNRSCPDCKNDPEGFVLRLLAERRRSADRSREAEGRPE